MRGVLLAGLSVGVLLAGLASTAPSAEPGKSKKADASVRVVVRGRLASGVVAIGGETTGTTITADKLVFELELPTPELKKQASQLDGQTAIVRGRLKRMEGVEVAERWIITVRAIQEP